jgi:hypothetical protein
MISRSIQVQEGDKELIYGQPPASVTGVVEDAVVVEAARRGKEEKKWIHLTKLGCLIKDGKN